MAFTSPSIVLLRSAVSLGPSAERSGESRESSLTICSCAGGWDLWSSSLSSDKGLWGRQTSRLASLWHSFTIYSTSINWCTKLEILLVPVVAALFWTTQLITAMDACYRDAQCTLPMLHHQATHAHLWYTVIYVCGCTCIAHYMYM